MASSSALNVASPLFGQVITEKLTNTNFPLWRAQVLPILRGAQLQGYLDGTGTPPHAELEAKDGEKVKKVPNLDHAAWKAMEQQVLGFLMTSLSREVMAQVATLETPQEVYGELVRMYASASRARTVNTRIALATTRKGNMSVTEYVAKIKFLADDMTSAGKKVDDEELVSYLLVGLDEEFSPVVTAVGARTESISVGELVSQLLSFEHRLDLLHGGSQGSANMAKRGRGGSNNRGRGNQQGRGGGRGRSGGRGRGLATPGGRGIGRGYFNNSSYSDDKPQCQICDKIGHTALECWYRLDEESYPNQRSASAATHSYGVDTNWYGYRLHRPHHWRARETLHEGEVQGKRSNPCSKRCRYEYQSHWSCYY
jgi:uncharacterized membrane protein YgcG